MKRRKSIEILGVLFLLSFVLSMFSGCTEAEEPKDEAPSAEVQTLSVATTASSKPNSYIDDEGTLTGYEVDILHAVDEALPEYAFAIDPVSQSAEEVGIDTGKYVLIAGQGFFRNADREAKYLIPEENTGVSLMKLFTPEADESINGLEDLKGKRLAPVPPNGGLYNLLIEYNEAHPDVPVDFTTAENVPIANRFQELAEGKYDAILWPSANLDLPAIEENLGVRFRATAPVRINNTYFLLAKGNEAFCDRLNEAIKKLKRDGTLSRLSERYFGEDIFQYVE
ncbi:MAG: transporter substrate-binding domain-containing protein [Clostridiales Family XIII bacterium]|jgi:L-cystine transport system substrate-binding protein|nr:transporter substrate-binding domain-containing protein [Clostridiales Family XIII bacterium]